MRRSSYLVSNFSFLGRSAALDCHIDLVLKYSYFLKVSHCGNRWANLLGFLPCEFGGAYLLVSS